MFLRMYYEAFLEFKILIRYLLNYKEGGNGWWCRWRRKKRIDSDNGGGGGR